MHSLRSIGATLTALGLLGAVVTMLLGFLWAPSVDPEAWNAPEAYRILFWHVPFAWSSFLAFSVLFTGSVVWYARRSELGWRLICTGSDLGLLFGLGVVISGPIWGSAEWGVPWDWGDLRLNTYGLLTAVALFLVLARNSQPEGHDTRDTIASVGLFGFALVPITALATTWYQERHPGIVIVETEEAGLAPEILTVLVLGFVSFFVLFAGFAILSDALHQMESRLSGLQRRLDEEAIH
jgi:heme exporter protein C